MEICNILGRIVKFSDRERETTLPLGSEGSIKYQLIENPDNSDISAYTIPIWGDLRDYDDAEYIESWFYDACNKIGRIRSAVLNIDVSGKLQKNISYKND